MKTRIIQFLTVILLVPVCAIANDGLRQQQIIDLYAKIDGAKYETPAKKSQIHDLAKVNYLKNTWNTDISLQVYNKLLNGTDFGERRDLKTVLLYEMELYDRAHPDAPIYKMDKRSFNTALTKIMYKIYPELNPTNQSELDQRLDAQGAVRDSETLTTNQLKSRVEERLKVMKANGADLSKYEAISIQ